MSVIIDQLQPLFIQKSADIQAWFDHEYKRTPPSFYSSVDVRHAGFKLAPVDTNLFPAGFNHLSPAARKRALMQIQTFITTLPNAVKRVLIVPENHTRNLGYLDNLQALKAILESAGLEVKIGNVSAPEILELADSSGGVLHEYPLLKQGNNLVTHDGFVADLIIINNDMTGGIPEVLKGITQPMVPAVSQGWYRRRKTIHFEAYAQVAHRFAKAFDFDPWLIAANFHQCGKVNFREHAGLECIALGVEKVLGGVRQKYADYGINQEPYVFIKADSGTYGMGIMTARSGDEVLEINKKIRNKMNIIKEGVQSTEVIIQEGIPTADRVDGFVAEPMLYLVNGEPVGGAFRVNEERDEFGNLNASGMRFKGMCDENEWMNDSPLASVKSCSFLVFGMIAKLATLAAAHEEYGDEWVI